MTPFKALANYTLLLTRAAVAYQQAKWAELGLIPRPVGKNGSRNRALTLVTKEDLWQ